MAKKIIQYRYYSDGNSSNFPATGLDAASLANGSFCAGKDVYQLGIQSLPGTIFYLQDSANPIMIGSTGIFELELRNETAAITSLKFDGKSLNLIKDNPNTYLIIDMIYEEV